MKTLQFNGIEYQSKESWNDVTCKDYYSLIDDSSIYNHLSIASGIPKDFIKNANKTLILKITDEFGWILNPKIPSKNDFILNIEGKKYFCDLSNIAFGQWVDVISLKDNPKNLHLMIAILVKPFEFKYTEWSFTAFSEKILECSIVELNSMLGFFLPFALPYNQENQMSMQDCQDYFNLKKKEILENLELSYKKLPGIWRLLNYRKMTRVRSMLIGIKM